MPKIGMEPIRRDALVLAAIAEIGRAGTLDVTVAQIANRAGMSSALAHHYFGSKEQMFLAAMRHILVVFGNEVRVGLAQATTPDERLEAIVRACFSAENFRPEVANAWLNFYVLALQSPQAGRLLTVYHKRLQSNLVYALKPLAGKRSAAIAASTGALIDGLYLRAVLPTPAAKDGGAPTMVMEHISSAIGAKQ